MKPLQPTRSINTAVLADLLEGDAVQYPGIIVDWIEETGIAPEDICLLYARDKMACEGLEEMACPTCGYTQGRSPDRNKSGAAICCPVCGPQGIIPSGIRWCNLWPLLRCNFPQSVFAEWAARMYGNAKCDQLRDRQLISDAIEATSNYHARQVSRVAWEGSGSIVQTVAVREYKRRSLRLLPEVTRQVEVDRGWKPQVEMAVDRDISVLTDSISLPKTCGLKFNGKLYYGTEETPLHWYRTGEGGNLVILKLTLRAEDFVPPEPYPVWSNNRVDLVSWPSMNLRNDILALRVNHGVSLRIGDQVSEVNGYVVPRTYNSERYIGVVIESPREDGTVLVRTNVSISGIPSDSLQVVTNPPDGS